MGEKRRKPIKRIEDLPEEMQESVKQCLLLYGNAFVLWDGDDNDDPVLLYPPDVTTIRLESTGVEYGKPLLVPRGLEMSKEEQDLKEKLEEVDALARDPRMQAMMLREMTRAGGGEEMSEAEALLELGYIHAGKDGEEN